MSWDWDMALAACAAFAQGVTGFVGWRVTVDGVRRERKVLYECLFVSATLIGIVCVSIAAHRGTAVSQQLADIRQGQADFQIRTRHTHVDFYNPMPLYAGSFQPFLVGKEPSINLGYHNGGDSDILDQSWDAELLIVDRSEVKAHAVFENHRRDIDVHHIVGGTVAAHSAAFEFHSYKIGPLSSENVNQLAKGDRAVCGLAMVQWHDETGHYQTNYCECMVAGNTAWQVCGPESNKEYKLPD